MKKKKLYIDRKKFDNLVKQYKNTRDENVYNELHPSLTVLIEMLIYKFTGVGNDTNTKRDRTDIESIKQNCYVRFLKALDTFDIKRDAFNYYYKVLWQDIINNTRYYSKYKARTIVFTEMENEDGDMWEIDNLSYTDNYINLNENFKQMVDYAKVYIRIKQGNIQRSVGKFIIDTFSDVDVIDKLNNYSDDKNLPLNILGHIYANKLGKNDPSGHDLCNIRAFIRDYKKYCKSKKVLL